MTPTFQWFSVSFADFRWSPLPHRVSGPSSGKFMFFFSTAPSLSQSDSRSFLPRRMQLFPSATTGVPIRFFPLLPHSPSSRGSDFFPSRFLLHVPKNFLAPTSFLPLTIPQLRSSNKPFSLSLATHHAYLSHIDPLFE